MSSFQPQIHNHDRKPHVQPKQSQSQSSSSQQNVQQQSQQQSKTNNHNVLEKQSHHNHHHHHYSSTTQQQYLQLNIQQSSENQNTTLKQVPSKLPLRIQCEEKYLKKSKYGNFVVFYDGPILISLGPDYCCFIPTLICFILAAVGLNMMAFKFTENILFQIITFLICFIHILSYILMAISNPGVAQFDTTNTNYSQIKFCKYCQLYVDKKTFHCKDCGFCILQYDHHCPWTSKCIGKNNLKRFYFFLSMTPIFIVYCIIGMVILGASLQSTARMNMIRRHNAAHPKLF